MSSDVHALLARLPGFPVLAGQRVRLRGPGAADADGVFALFSDPAVMRYWTSVPMQVRAQAERKVEEMRMEFTHRDRIHWLVTERRGDAVIGSCSLFRFDARRRLAEIGYALRSDHWGRGLATEAVSLVLDWGFRALALRRVEADIDARNDASRRLLARLGFQREDPPRPRFIAGHTLADAEVHALPAQAWQARGR